MLVVLGRCLSNSSPTPLGRALRAYRAMNLRPSPRPRGPQPQSKQARRLTTADLARLAKRYEAGATVYELAAEFGVSRHTIARRLKDTGIRMRAQSPHEGDVDEMVRLYETGLSLAAVGQRLGFAARTVQHHVQARGVRTRDTHGRRS